MLEQLQEKWHAMGIFANNWNESQNDESARPMHTHTHGEIVAEETSRNKSHDIVLFYFDLAFCQFSRWPE